MLSDYEIVVFQSTTEIVIEASLEVIGIAAQGPPGPKGSDGIPVIPDYIDLGSFV